MTGRLVRPVGFPRGGSRIHRRTTLFAVLTLSALVLAACGDGGASATCSPSGTELHIAVLESQSHQFDTDCLAAPAGEPFTIEFDNQDTSPHGNHNVNIVGLFVGDFAKHGTSITYQVGALEAGTYQFRCDEHMFMNGTFIVR